MAILFRDDQDKRHDGPTHTKRIVREGSDGRYGFSIGLVILVTKIILMCALDPLRWLPLEIPKVGNMMIMKKENYLAK